MEILKRKINRLQELRGKTALITGGASKIGREIAEALAKEGVNIIVHYNKNKRGAQALCDYLEDLGVRAYKIKTDFEKKEEREELIEKAISITKEFTILINNASIYKSPEEGSFEEFMKNLEINAWTPYFLSMKFAEKVKRGEIINMLDARIDDFHSRDFFYIISKQVLATITKRLSLELSPNIRVNGIAPGHIIPSKGKKLIDKLTSKIILLLKSPSMNGKIIYVDE